MADHPFSTYVIHPSTLKLTLLSIEILVPPVQLHTYKFKIRTTYIQKYDAPKYQGISSEKILKNIMIKAVPYHSSKSLCFSGAIIS